MTNATIPEGWKLVPIEPTTEMCLADWNVSMSDAHSTTGVSRCAWEAMLAVAPEYEPEDASPSSVPAPAQKQMSDEEIIDRCAHAGIRWIEPDADEDGFPGSFDMVTMDEMRALLSAQKMPARPLTDEEIEPLFREAKAIDDKGGIKDEWFWFAWGVEFGERAHGIRPGAQKMESAEGVKPERVEIGRLVLPFDGNEYGDPEIDCFMGRMEDLQERLVKGETINLPVFVEVGASSESPIGSAEGEAGIDGEAPCPKGKGECVDVAPDKRCFGCPNGVMAAPAPSKADERMRHDYPILQQFHSKHALGALSAPSCLCCGHQTHPITRPIAVQHMELPAIVVCKQCKDAAAGVTPAPAPQPDEDEQWAIDRGADFLEQYAGYIHRVKPEDIEQHPYLPELERVAEELRALSKRIGTDGVNVGGGNDGR